MEGTERMPGALTSERNDDVRRIVRRWPSWGAVAGAVVFFCLSFTPSMLPRPWVLQGLVGALTATVGYGIGAFLGHLVRIAGAEPGRRFRHGGWLALGMVGSAAVVFITAWSVRWQGDMRRAVGMDPRLVWWQWTLVPLLALFVLALLVGVARVVRLVARVVVHALGRFVPRWIGTVVGIAVVALLVVSLVQGIVLKGLLAVAERSASLANGSTSPGIMRPTSPTLSGSPESFESWESLGAKGRDFVGHARTKAQLSAYSGRSAREPVRVYVGLKSAPTLAERARMAVSELERTGGFSRKVLVVMSTTGTGWVNERAAEPLEYMYAGDSALVAMQYSYLPSWVSFLTEDEAADAGAALIDAVHAKWVTLPAATRPRLLVYGESLGSYATENAFAGQLPDAVSHTDGGLLVGPTPDNPMWQTITAGRDRGSPVWRPVYQQGRTVRFAQRPTDFVHPSATWSEPRIIYLQNGSDPVTWWSPNLLWHKPAWLNSPRAPDVSADMSWYPLVTFWQVACDLAGADNVPDGYGHRFGNLPTYAWSKIAPPAGWNDADTDRLADYLRVHG